MGIVLRSIGCLYWCLGRRGERGLAILDEIWYVKDCFQVVSYIGMVISAGFSVPSLLPMTGWGGSVL